MTPRCRRRNRLVGVNPPRRRRIHQAEGDLKNLPGSLNRRRNEPGGATPPPAAAAFMGGG